MTTGEKIKQTRKKAGFTQKELGEKLNLSQVRIAQYENGARTPKLETLRRIATALGIYIGDLVDDWSEFSYEEMKEDWINNSITPDELTEFTAKGRKDTISNLLDLMNVEGQKKAVEQVELLTKIPEYQKED